PRKWLLGAGGWNFREIIKRGGASVREIAIEQFFREWVLRRDGEDGCGIRLHAVLVPVRKIGLRHDGHRSDDRVNEWLLTFKNPQCDAESILCCNMWRHFAAIEFERVLIGIPVAKRVARNG